MYKKIIKFWPLLLLIALTFLLRIYNLEKLFYFTYDEEIPAFVGRRLLLWHHIPLIGGATPFGFHLAPYFYWFYSGLLLVGKLNPLIWGAASAAISVFTTLLMYKVGVVLGGKKVGITAAIFWTFSLLANIYDRHLWALFWGPLVSLFVIYFLQKIISGHPRAIYPLAITIAVAIHADPSNLVFLALIVLVIMFKKLDLKKNLSIIALAIFVFAIPLIAFDLRHNFSNTLPSLNFIKTGNNTPAIRTQKFINNSLLFPQAATRLIYKFGNTEVAKDYSYCAAYVAEKFTSIPSSALFFLSVGFTLFTLWAIFKRKKSWALVSALIILYYLGIQFYGTILGADIFEHYLAGIFPSLFLILAFFISLLPKKLWLMALGLYVAVNLYKLSILQNSQGLTEKRKAIEYTLTKVEDNPFSLDSLSTCWRMNGYRYLFAIYGREPVKSYVDPNFAYLYGTTQVWDQHPQTVVAFVVHDFEPETPSFYQRYALLKSHEISSTLFGSIEVIIMNNSNSWFD